MIFYNGEKFESVCDALEQTFLVLANTHTRLSFRV